MNEIYLAYSEHETGGEICAGEENDSFPSREDAYIDFKPLGLYTKMGNSQETISVEFDPKEAIGKNVYLVIASYSDGDTFGQTHGHWYIVGCYLDEHEAKLRQSQVYNKSQKSDYYPWNGYFASLETIDIYATTLRDEECTGIQWF